MTSIWMFQSAALPIMPISHQPRQKGADRGTANIKVNPTQVWDLLNHPVPTLETVCILALYVQPFRLSYICMAFPFLDLESCISALHAWCDNTQHPKSFFCTQGRRFLSLWSENDLHETHYSLRMSHQVVLPLRVLDFMAA